MGKKKIHAIILPGVVGFVIGVLGINYYNPFTDTQNIKVIAYKPSAKVNEDGFQIDKYGNVESVAWLSENEVLTLSKKSEFVNPGSTRIIRYCSIYDLNTKQSKDFKDVNIDEFLGVSPDKKYVLYAETIPIPKTGSSEWVEAVKSGALFHKNVKLLNLLTGQITDLNSQYLNSNGQFIWISNNKILVNYINTQTWAIIDTTGKVYDDGNFNEVYGDCCLLAGADEIKDTGNSVEGKFYYTKLIFR
jgi:hypothetical protein